MFRSLDFIYAPTRNAEEELDFCTKVLGGEAEGASVLRFTNLSGRK